jgi:hypothetical protein
MIVIHPIPPSTPEEHKRLEQLVELFRWVASLRNISMFSYSNIFKDTPHENN